MSDKTELTEELVKAIEKRDLELTRKLLINPNLDINNKSNKGWSKGKTPLHVAAYNGEYLIVLMLLMLRAKVDIKDDNYSTPLHLATYKEYLKLPKINGKDCYDEIVKVLISEEADVNARNCLGETPLHRATKWRYGGKCKIIRLLVNAGADVNAIDDNGYSILDNIYSVKAPDKIRKFLRESGAKLHSISVEFAKS